MTWNREHVLNSEEKLSDFSPVLSHIPVQPLPVCQRLSLIAAERQCDQVEMYYLQYWTPGT